MSYSTNPVRDQMRHADAQEAAEAMRAERQRSMYEDTMARVKQGDFSRLLETLSWDDKNGEIALSGLNVGRKHGSVSAARALQFLARAWAEQYSKE